MGAGPEQWKDQWRRFGPLGMVAKAVLKASDRSLGLDFEAQYVAPLDSVVAALAGVDNVKDRIQIRVLKGRKKRLPLLQRLRDMHPTLSFADLSACDRIAIAEDSDELVGYWCFTLREDSLHDRGVAVTKRARGRGLAGRLLLAATQSIGDDLANKRLVATSDLFNRASRRMLERCGLQWVGTMTRGRLPLMGEFHLMWKPPG